MLSTLFYLLVFAIPFGARKLLYQFTPGFHEYEAIFLYASDILLVVFLIVAAISYIKNQNAKIKSINKNAKSFLLVAFLLIAGVSIFFAPAKWLALYSFARLLLVALFAVATAYVVRAGIVRFRAICAALAASAVLQSLIAFAQFVKQGSVGLWFLGEPALSGNAPGIAKFAVGGGRLLRAYGTFPHPNILGAFLSLGFIACFYLFFSSDDVLKIRNPNFEIRNNNKIQNSENQNSPVFKFGFFGFVSGFVLRISSFYVILLGLTLTFSRSAWFVAVIASVALLFYGFMQSELRRRALSLLFILVTSGFALVAILSPFIFARATISAGEPSVTARVEYGALGVELIRSHPFGVGIGNQVLYSVQNGLYQQRGMTEVWGWEPIHDIYLLMASEVGVFGAGAFLVFIILLLSTKHENRNSKQARNNEQYQNLNAQNSKRFWFLNFNYSDLFRISDFEFRISAIMLLSLLVFGIADHFLWTLQPGRLMLWLVVGLVWGIAQKPLEGVL